MSQYRKIVSKYSDRGEETGISVGIRPSGRIHLGNMITIGYAGLLARDIGPHISKVNMTVCDLDLPDRSDWSVERHNFVRYFNSIKRGNSTLLDIAMRGLNNYVEGLENALSIKFDVKLLSEVQRSPDFRTGLARVLESEGLMQMIKPDVPEGSVLVYPICGVCGTSSPYYSKYEKGVLSTSCLNPACEIEAYNVEVEDVSKDLAVHFFIDPLRDEAGFPADVHVFGGDYKELHCGDIPKIDKITQVIKAASGGKVPDFLFAPLVLARGGEKMSKSKNNGLLMENLGEGYYPPLVKFIDYLVEQEFNVVDYPVIRERFLENH